MSARRAWIEMVDRVFTDERSAFAASREPLPQSRIIPTANAYGRTGLRKFALCRLSVRRKDGNERAAAEFGAALVRLARGYKADTDKQRDLLQEIHFALWRSFEAFPPAYSLRTWVYRVAARQAPCARGDCRGGHAIRDGASLSAGRPDAAVRCGTAVIAGVPPHGIRAAARRVAQRVAMVPPPFVPETCGDARRGRAGTWLRTEDRKNTSHGEANHE